MPRLLACYYFEPPSPSHGQWVTIVMQSKL